VDLDAELDPSKSIGLKLEFLNKPPLQIAQYHDNLLSGHQQASLSISYLLLQLFSNSLSKKTPIVKGSHKIEL